MISFHKKLYVKTSALYIINLIFNPKAFIFLWFLRYFLHFSETHDNNTENCPFVIQILRKLDKIFDIVFYGEWLQSKNQNFGPAFDQGLYLIYTVI